MTRLASRTVVVAAALCVALNAVPTMAVAATPAVTFHVVLGFVCVYGAAPADQALTMTLKTSDRQWRQRIVTRTTPSGTYDVCFDSTSGVQAGDILVADYGSNTRSFSVPSIEPGIDRVTNVISGRAPAGTHLDFVIGGQLIQGGGSEGGVHATGTAGSLGRYRLDASPLKDLKGGDGVQTSARFGADTVMAQTFTPMVEIVRGDNAVSGYTDREQVVRLRILSSSGVVRARTSAAPPFGSFYYAPFVTTLGDPVYPRPGDTVVASIAPDARLLVPVWRLSGDAQRDVITGRCMPDAPIKVRISKTDVFKELIIHDRTRSDGHFRLDIGDRFNLAPGDSLFLQCTYPSGDLLDVINIAE